MGTPRRALTIVAAVATIVLTGCGGEGSDGDATDTAAPTTGTASTPSEDPAAPSTTDPGTPPPTTGTDGPATGTGSGPGSPGEEDATSPPTPTGTTGDGPPFPADTEPDEATGSGPPVLVTDVEIGRHEAFDRVVLTLGGEGTAGWLAHYVDEAVEQGRGEPIEVPGAGVLEILLTNNGYPGDVGAEPYDGPVRLDGYDAVTEVVYGSIFEGQTQVIVGTAERLPFRVFALEDPARVVVDVVHADAAG